MNTSTQRQFQLEQFYRGKWWENGLEKSDLIITACSQGVSSREAEQLFAGANLGSFNRTDLARLQHGYGLLQANAETYLLLHVRPGPRRARGYVYPDYRCIVVPGQVMRYVAGNLQPLQALLDDAPHLPELTANDSTLPRVTLTVEPASIEQEIQLVQPLFQEFAHKLELLEQLLSALIAGRSVAVLGAPPDPAWRWAICQALLLVLPPQLRQRWTFATEVFDSDGCPVRLKFLYKDPYVRPAAEDLQCRWQNGEFRSRLHAIHPYTQWVTQHWGQGAPWLIKTLHNEVTITLVDLFKGSLLQDVLVILADRLTMLNLEEDKLQPENWSTIQRLLTNQMQLLTTSTLSPEATNWLIENSQTILRAVTKQGLGASAYSFLDRQLQNPRLDRQKWRSTLEWIALEYLGQQPGEADLLDFVNSVEQTSSELSNEFWNEFTDALRPACAKSAQITWPLLTLWLAHKTTVDYKDFLLDSTTPTQFPDDLTVLRHHLLSLPPSAQERPVSLIAISRKLPQGASRFFLDMVQEAITRQAFTLVDINAIAYLVELAQQPEYKEPGLRLVGQLLAAKDQLGEEVLTELPHLLIVLAQIDSAVDLLTYLAQLPQFDKIFPPLIGNLCHTAVLPNPLGFLEKLEQVSAFSHTITYARLGLLEREDWNILPTVSDKMIDQLRRITQAYVESVLDDSDPWSIKATKLNQLQFTPAVARISSLLPLIADTINLYARKRLKPAEILNVRAELEVRSPELLKRSRLDGLALLVETFGSHRVQNITSSLAMTVRLLQNLDILSQSWRDYAAEIRSQMNTLPLEQQHDFVQNCHYLLALLNAQPETNSDPVNVFAKLLDTVWQRMRPMPTSKEPPERNLLKKFMDKFRDI